MKIALGPAGCQGAMSPLRSMKHLENHAGQLLLDRFDARLRKSTLRTIVEIDRRSFLSHQFDTCGWGWPEKSKRRVPPVDVAPLQFAEILFNFPPKPPRL